MSWFPGRVAEDWKYVWAPEDVARAESYEDQAGAIVYLDVNDDLLLPISENDRGECERDCESADRSRMQQSEMSCSVSFGGMAV